MKKIVLFLALTVIVPAAMFAQATWGIGGAAFYKSPVLVGQPIDATNLNSDQFSFGGDVRLKVSAFQVEGLLLYAGGNNNSLITFLDAGIAADIAILRLSLGAGPNFTYNINSTNAPVQAGFNAKVGADLVFGPVSLGVSYIMALNIGSNTTINTGSGLLGVDVIFWM